MGACNCLAKQSSNPELINERQNTTPGKNSSRIHKVKAPQRTDEENVVKIQSVYRGHKARQKMDVVKLDQYKARVIEQLQAYIETCTQNPFVNKLSKCEYLEDELDDPLFYNRVFKSLYEVPGGGVYLGEWYNLISNPI